MNQIIETENQGVTEDSCNFLFPNEARLNDVGCKPELIANLMMYINKTGIYGNLVITPLDTSSDLSIAAIAYYNGIPETMVNGQFYAQDEQVVGAYTEVKNLQDIPINNHKLKRGIIPILKESVQKSFHIRLVIGRLHEESLFIRSHLVLNLDSLGE